MIQIRRSIGLEMKGLGIMRPAVRVDNDERIALSDVREGVCWYWNAGAGGMVGAQSCGGELQRFLEGVYTSETKGLVTG